MKNQSCLLWYYDKKYIIHCKAGGSIIELVEEAQKGNQESFMALFHSYEKNLYRIANTYVKNSNDTYDVIQETAYRTYEKLPELRNPQYFKTWITKITINCALDTIRKNKKMIIMEPEKVSTKAYYDLDIPLKITVEQLLDRLNEKERTIIVLRFYYALSFKEISEQLDIPYGTTKSLSYRALKKLKYFANKQELQ
ncbi:sigma-70 family RNA polymerase sigma factor [Oceanobacillus iheyensis]|nr:sigma-70 family RNA polymerase sigma factor [Oceanobacillus iheyensis]